MNLSINGQSQVPPGFRFHPTEEELLQYYLRKKVTPEKIDHLDVIPYVELNKLEPWDIQEKCKIGSTPQNEWYFFNHKDKKYPTGSRTNRATEAGFWKATVRDKVVYNNVGRIGLRKTLVFYIGRAPCGQKSDWIMYEYRLDENTQNDNVCNLGEPKAEDGWVICRLFRKKNYNKSQDSPQSSSISTDLWTQIHNLSNDGDLDQVLRCMDKPCKQENETMSNITSNNTMEFHNNSLDKAIGDRFLDRFTNLPVLESPTIRLNDQECSFEEMLLGFKPSSCTQQVNPCNSDTVDETEDQGLNEWLGLDQLLASKFNGQVETSKQLSCYDECSKDFDHHLHVPQLCSNRPNQASQVHSNDMDLWSFT